MVLYMAGRHDDAVAQLAHTLTLDSTYVLAHMWLAHALTSSGRTREAIEEANGVVLRTGRSGASVGALGKAMIAAGRLEDARSLLRELVARSHREYIPPNLIGQMYATLGDPDAALPWLTEAVAEHSNAIVFVDVDPAAEPTLRDPRYQAVLARAGFR
jgi:Flp pilus assembly protein TadD